MMNERPKCCNPKCNNDGWVSFAGGFYCGECVAKFDRKQKERMRKELEND